MSFGDVKLGKMLLPGIVVDVDVSGEVKSDQNQVEGSGRQVNTPVGFGDDRVTVTLSLLNDEKGSVLDKIRQIQALYRSSPKKLTPEKYRITNDHIQARGIDEVYFSYYKTKEDEENDIVTATLEFIQYNVIIVKVSKKTSSTTASEFDQGVFFDFDMPVVNPLPKVNQTPGVDDDVPPDLQMLFRRI